jgi:hypothetical protein
VPAAPGAGRQPDGAPGRRRAAVIRARLASPRGRRPDRRQLATGCVSDARRAC